MHDKLILLAAALLATATAAWADKAAHQSSEVNAKDLLANLRKDHPRLLLTDARLAELKKLAKTDKLLAKCVQDVIAQADKLLQEPDLAYKKVGPRLLSISRSCLRRVYSFGLAWRWTGESKYFDKAREAMLDVCAFKDWNPSHFLDTAEMSHAVGIGYDWFYSELSKADREKIRQGLIRLGMQPGLKAYRGARFGWWRRCEHNWNQVCNMGLSIGALALADSDPEVAGEILANAVANLPEALHSYAPDGGWGEGPGYWSYATAYTAYGLAAMETALGTDFGLSQATGLDKTGYFPIYLTGPTGLMFGYADVHTPLRRWNLPMLMYLSKQFDNPFFAQVEREMLTRRPAAVADVIWYVPPADPSPKPDLARLFRGPVPSAVFRTSWSDPNAMFLAFKAGFNQVSHAHLDVGQFELDALGVRWVRDLGSDYYNLPGYFRMHKEAKRWKYYRLSSAGHSVVTLDGENQNVTAVTQITDFKADGNNGFAVADLTSAYTPKAKRALRGVRMLDGRGVLVQDELEIAHACSAQWAMTTDASITAAGASATLSLKGRTLTAHILSPAGATFTARSAEQKRPQASNKGVSQLIIRTNAKPGPLRFAVLLCPQPADGPDEKPNVKLAPLAQWNAPVIAEAAARDGR